MRRNRQTQREAILQLLRSRMDGWIALPEILALGIAQFGARLLELRRDGYVIKNKTEHSDGKVFSSYRLESEPSVAAPFSQATAFPEFGALAPQRYGD